MPCIRIVIATIAGRRYFAEAVKEKTAIMSFLFLQVGLNFRRKREQHGKNENHGR